MFLLAIAMICYTLGIMFLFRRSLILIANVSHQSPQVLFLAGLYFFIGIAGTVKFFSKKGKKKGSVVYFIGLILIWLQFTFFGALVQLSGLFIIFRSFLPEFYDYLCRLPFVGHYLSIVYQIEQKAIQFKMHWIRFRVIKAIGYESVFTRY